MKIDHINISAPKKYLEPEKVFLCEVFQLKEGPRPNFSRPGYWLYHEDKPLIHMVQSDTHVKHETNGFLDHVAFQMTGLEALVNRLNALGIDFTTTNLTEIGTTQLFFYSPSGLRLEANFVDEVLS